MRAVHALTGSTGSSVADRQGRDAQSRATMTMHELERWLLLEVAGKNHHMIHASLHRPPVAVWREHMGDTPLRLPPGRLRFWVGFLPEERRHLRRDGIHLFAIRYWSPALSQDVGRGEQRLIVQYDPRDLSTVFVRRTNGQFVEARYRSLGRPPISLRPAQRWGCQPLDTKATSMASSFPGSVIPGQAKRRRRRRDLWPLAVEGDRQPRQRKILARYVLDEAERLHLRLRQRLCQGVDRRAGNAGRCQRLQPVPTRFLDENCGHPFNEQGSVGQPGAIVGEPRIGLANPAFPAPHRASRKDGHCRHISRKGPSCASKAS